MTDLSRIRAAQGALPETAVRRASSLAHSEPTLTAGNLAASAAHRRAVELATAVPPMSRSDLPGRNTGRAQGEGIRSALFREWFKDRWAAWLRAEFRSPEHVAAVFAVRQSTAVSWWNGENRASGDAVAFAFTSFPTAFRWFAETSVGSE